MSTAAGMPVRHILSISGGKPAPCFPAFDMLGPILTKQYPKPIVGDSMWHNTTEALGVTRMTASAYLNKIVKLGLLSKFKVGRVNYYINEKLVDLLVNHEKLADSK